MRKVMDLYENDNKLYTSSFMLYKNKSEAKEKIKEYSELIKQGSTKNENDSIYTAKLYMDRGFIYKQIDSIGQAEEDFSNVIDICKDYKDQGTLDKKYLTSLAYLYRSQVYVKCLRLEAALSDGNNAVYFAENIKDKNGVIYTGLLVMAYVNMIQYFMSDIQKALTLCEKAINTAEQLDSMNKLADRNILIKTYISRGTEEDIENSLAVAKRIQDEGKPLLGNLLINADYNMGVINRRYGDIHIAIENYTLAIDQGKKFKDEYQFIEDGIIIKAYINRASCYRYLNEHNKSIKDNTDAIKIGEGLLRRGIPFEENNLVKAYTNRGICYNDNKWVTKVRDFNRAVEIGEKLKCEGKYFDGNDIMTAYSNLAGCYIGMLDAPPNYETAIKYYEKVIEFGEELKKKGEIYNEDILSKAYYRRREWKRLYKG